MSRRWRIERQDSHHPPFNFLNILAFLVAPTDAEQPQRAGLILTHVRIVTLDEQAKRLAVKDDRPLAIGNEQQMINQDIGRQMQVVNLDCAFGVPGFIEDHRHFLTLGRSTTNLDRHTVEVAACR